MDSETENRLRKSLRLFKSHQLYEYAIREIPEVIWDDVTNHVTNLRKTLTAPQAINIIIKCTSDLQLDRAEIYKLVDRLELLGHIISENRNWNAHILLNQNHPLPEDIWGLQRKLKRALSRESIRAKVVLIEQSGKYGIQISKKYKSSGKYSQPMYFVHTPDTKYFFCTKVVPDDSSIVNALCEALGYNKFKPCNLSGKNIDDLLKLLVRKEKNRHVINFVTPEFVPLAKLTGVGNDYTQRQERNNYVDDLYGVKPPSLQSLTFNVRDAPCSTNIMKGLTFSSQLQFQSPDVLGMIKDMAVEGVCPTPVPDYLASILKRGKNVFSVNKDT